MAGKPLYQVIDYLRNLAGAGTDEAVSDRQLLERFRQSWDEPAFTALIQRHGPMVLSVCNRVLHDAHLAEDAFQAAFLVLARKAGAIRQLESLGGWLYRVAYHLAVRARRSNARKQAQELRESTMANALEETDLSWREACRILDEELSQLPDKFRVPLVLCYLEGKTNEAAALELGWPTGSMSRRLTRGRELLRKRLLRRGVAFSTGMLAALVPATVPAAALPASLVAATARAGVAYGSGAAAAGLVSSQAAALVDVGLAGVGGVKLAGTLLAAVVLAIGGAFGVAAFLGSANTPAPQLSPPNPGKAPTAADAVAWGRAVRGLRLHVETDRSSYRLGRDLINVGFVIQNQAIAPVAITLRPTQEELADLWLRSAEGKTFRIPAGKFPGHKFAPWETIIRPGKVARASKVFEISQVNDAIPPGVYRLGGTYRFRAPPGGGQGAEEFLLEAPEVTITLRGAEEAAAFPNSEAVGDCRLTLQAERRTWKPGDGPLPFAVVMHALETNPRGAWLVGVHCLTYYHLEVQGPDGKKITVPQPVALPSAMPLPLRALALPAGKRLGQRLCWDPAGQPVRRTPDLDDFLLASGPAAPRPGKYKVRAVYQVDQAAEADSGYPLFTQRVVSNWVEVTIAPPR